MTLLKKWWYLFIYKPKTKKLYWEKIISSIIVLVAFAIWGYFNQTKTNRLKKQRNKYAKYTIGITNGSFNNVKGGRKIHYKYKIEGDEYSERNYWPWLNNSVVTTGGRYFVKFDSTNASNAEMLFRCPVPENIQDAPKNGWNDKPINCEEK
ncbi:MAG TPA: hypothetical protein VKC90_03305 [Chitinophagaceae bacterium]|nr:hypothetical protein [Chitinophagaceae bacterium]